MGLDMYLNKRIFLYGIDENNNTIKFTNGNDLTINNGDYIIKEVGYWRKANAIHKWFVDNIQEGEDDCREYAVYESDLFRLLNICKQVIKNKNKCHELLPTQSGFFFGGIQYDENYFEDIKYTIDILKKLNLDKDGYKCYYYQSSW